MKSSRIRHYPTSGGLVSGIGDVRFVLDKKHKDPVVPVVPDSSEAYCGLFEDMGHCVHHIQVRRAIGQPLYKMKIVATGQNYFIAVLNRKRIKFYTHRAPQMAALLEFYGPRLVGWLHELSLFECQGHFFSVTTDPDDFLECGSRRTTKPKKGWTRVSDKEWVNADQQPAVQAALGKTVRPVKGVG